MGRMMHRTGLQGLTIAVAALLAVPASAETLYGLGGSMLVKVDTSRPFAPPTLVAGNFLPGSSITFGPDGLLYGFDLSSRVQRIDLSTGDRRLIAGAFVPTGDITFGPDGRLYGLTSANTIISLDIASQQTLLVASNISPRGDLRFGPGGKLYAMDSTLDLMEFTRTGFSSWSQRSIAGRMHGSGGLTVGPAGKLYAIDDFSSLLEIDPQTRFIDRLGSSGEWGSGDLQFGADGLLYGFGLTGRLQRMDTATGTVSFLTSGLDGNADLAFQPSTPVPEPGPAMLLMLGLPAIVWRRLRRGKKDIHPGRSIR